MFKKIKYIIIYYHMIGARSVFYLGLLLLSAYFTGSLFYFISMKED